MLSSTRESGRGDSKSAAAAAGAWGGSMRPKTPLSLSLSCLEKLKRDSQQPTVFVV
jgi:hypothetical protein